MYRRATNVYLANTNKHISIYGKYINIVCEKYIYVFVYSDLSIALLIYIILKTCHIKEITNQTHFDSLVAQCSISYGSRHQESRKYSISVVSKHLIQQHVCRGVCVEASVYVGVSLAVHVCIFHFPANTFDMPHMQILSSNRLLPSHFPPCHD